MYALKRKLRMEWYALVTLALPSRKGIQAKAPIPYQYAALQRQTYLTHVHATQIIPTQTEIRVMRVATIVFPIA